MEKLKAIIDDAMGELEGTLSGDQTDKVAKVKRADHIKSGTINRHWGNLNTMRYLKGSFAILGLVLIAGCQQTESIETAAPQRASIQEAVEATAIVQTVDFETRQILLKAEDGRMLTIVASSEVRNLEQVEPGDKVKVVYVQGVAAQLVAPGQAAAGTEVTTEIARAAKGAKPAAMVHESVRTVVKIVSFDVPSNLVTFATPDGLVHSIVVRKPEMQKFARGLKPGDEVEVTFTESVAVGIVEIDE